MAKKKNPMEIIVVLDRSGSMESCKEEAISGFNEFLKEQRKVKREMKISLYQFDNVYEIVYEEKNVKAAPELTDKTYVPRAMTALLDAVGTTIKSTSARLKRKKKKRDVIFMVLTDGYENASQEFTKDQIKTMIEEAEKEKWQFVFLGANQDAFAEGHAMGIASNSTMNFNSTATGAMIDGWKIMTGAISANAISGGAIKVDSLALRSYDAKYSTDNTKNY